MQQLKHRSYGMPEPASEGLVEVPAADPGIGLLPPIQEVTYCILAYRISAKEQTKGKVTYQRHTVFMKLSKESWSCALSLRKMRIRSRLR